MHCASTELKAAYAPLRSRFWFAQVLVAQVTVAQVTVAQVTVAQVLAFRQGRIDLG